MLEESANVFGTGFNVNVVETANKSAYKPANKNLELGRSTIARMRKEAMKALSGQAHLEPERILRFLKNQTQAETA